MDLHFTVIISEMSGPGDFVKYVTNVLRDLVSRLLSLLILTHKHRHSTLIHGFALLYMNHTCLFSFFDLRRHYSLAS